MKKDNAIVKNNILDMPNLNEDDLNKEENLIKLNVSSDKTLLIKDYVIHMESLLNNEKHKNNKLKQDYDKLLAEKDNQTKELHKLSSVNNELNESLKKLNKINTQLKNKEKKFLSSNSWKITAPLRKIGKFLRNKL